MQTTKYRETHNHQVQEDEEFLNYEERRPGCCLTLSTATVQVVSTIRHEGRKAQIKLGFSDLCRLQRIPIPTAMQANRRTSFHKTLYIGMYTVEKGAFSHSPPPDILCCYTELRQKSGAVLALTQRFGHEDFILQKFIKGFRNQKELGHGFFTILKI